MGEQQPEFKHAVCRGSYVLGTACGRCERCAWWRRTHPDQTEVPERVFIKESEFASAWTGVQKARWLDSDKEYVSASLYESLERQYNDLAVIINDGESLDDHEAIVDTCKDMSRAYEKLAEVVSALEVSQAENKRLTEQLQGEQKHG